MNWLFLSNFSKIIPTTKMRYFPQQWNIINPVMCVKRSWNTCLNPIHVLTVYGSPTIKNLRLLCKENEMLLVRFRKLEDSARSALVYMSCSGLSNLFEKTFLLGLAIPKFWHVKLSPKPVERTAKTSLFCCRQVMTIPCWSFNATFWVELPKSCRETSSNIADTL